MAQLEPPAEPGVIQGREKPSFGKMLFKNFWGLLTLIIVIVVCVIVVQVFKKPGQMSVIESAAMDMSVMVPPEGAVPVALTKVERGETNSSVVYTGTVQAFSDEDVYPRVTGQVLAMPVYSGDTVKKGQLLVQLDPSGNSEYSAKREEAQSAEDAAMHNAGIAKSELAQKKYQLEAAKEAEEGARKAIQEAESNLAYWKPELERQSALLKAQVVSLDEYQKELAELKTAKAKVDQAKAKLRELSNSRLAAQADLDTAIHHVGHQSSAAEQAKAVLKTARINENYTRIVAQDDGVVVKRLISPGVLVSPGMLLLKIAHIKRVRIQAQVANDDAEKIHVGDKVYIKSSENSSSEVAASISSMFPAADASSRTVTVESLIENSSVEPAGHGRQASNGGHYKFLPGQYVIMRIITGQKYGLTVPTSAIQWREGKAQVWKVTSGITSSNPAGDMASSVSKYTCPMHPEIITEKPGNCPKCNMKLVPMNSADKEVSQSSAPQFTCTMHPEVLSVKPGNCPKCGMPLVPKKLGGRQTAQLVEVTLGLSNSDRSEIISGLNEGDLVVYAGQGSLQPGMAVVDTKWGRTGPIDLPLASDLSTNRLDKSNNWTKVESSGDITLKVSLAPATGSNNSIIVTVRKKDGAGLSGAKVSIKTSMPSMNMPGMNVSGNSGVQGEVQLKTNLMSGLWRVDMTVSAPGDTEIFRSLDVEVP